MRNAAAHAGQRKFQLSTSRSVCVDLNWPFNNIGDFTGDPNDEPVPTFALVEF
jgi:hypothetical protein